MARYVSRPQHVEAVQWTGENWGEVMPFGGPDGKIASTVHGEAPNVAVGEPLQLLAGKDGAQGWVPVPVGHWIVHMPADKSDIWPVDPDYFAAKYEPAQRDGCQEGRTDD
jgi:hypothetical protein